MIPAISRVKFTRPPFAEMSISSLMLAPLKTSVSLPVPPSTVSLPSPGFQTKRVVARTKRGHVIPAPAVDEVASRAAGDGVVAIAAVDREIDLPGVEPGRVDDVVSDAAVDDKQVSAGIGALDRDLCRQAIDGHRRAAGDYADRVVGRGAVDSDGIRDGVALAAARHRRQIDGDLLDGGSGEVVDVDVVDAAQRCELDILNAVDVHNDIADVAEQPRPLAVGGDVDALVDVGAIEDQRIGAGLALNDIAAVAGIPGERVVTVTEQRHVAAATAVDDVIAITADQPVVALASGDAVGAGAAIDGQAHDVRPAGLRH